MFRVLLIIDYTRKDIIIMNLITSVELINVVMIEEN